MFVTGVAKAPPVLSQYAPAPYLTWIMAISTGYLF